MTMRNVIGERKPTVDDMDIIASEAAELLDQHQRNPYGQHDGWWECMCGRRHDGAHLLAMLHEGGYSVMRPITAVEEAANQW